ncbi:hypothetical protein UFOVP756_26 [uncultured Caudovirales phage]|uniref:Uncharacterized protein n=1 Tax=uncultured Caudovirales phage TaxID=2100421 RepID=A0A6J7X543_9CAUD|nr:hypothetical protein UFOVP756_26 [uncultured Caudovirales phage]
MKRTILYNGKHYELVHWNFRYLEAKDEFGNKLLIKHSQYRNNLWKQLKLKTDSQTK